MYALKRLIHESHTNGYSWPILNRFRSSMDLQCVINAYGAACYILGYTSKAEVEAFNVALERAIRETKGVLPETKEQIYVMGLKLLRARRVGMHEAAFRVCSFPLKLDSREFVWLAAYHPSERKWYININKAKDYPELKEPQVISLYRTRPTTGFVDLPSTSGDASVRVPWAELPLKTFAMWIEKDPELYPKSTGEHLRVRSKAAIVSTPQYKIEDFDKYYYQLLLLYKPWYDDADLIQKGSNCGGSFC